MDKFYVKDKQIKIYFERDSEDGIIKHYIHPIDSYLKAYVRQIASFETSYEQAMHDTSQLIFIINNRNIRTDMFIEFNNKTYNINSIDNYEFYKNNNLKLITSEIEPHKYIKVLGSDLNDYSKY